MAQWQALVVGGGILCRWVESTVGGYPSSLSVSSLNNTTIVVTQGVTSELGEPRQLVLTFDI